MANYISIKEAALSLLTILMGITNVYFWRGLIFSENHANLTLFSLPIISLFLFAIFFSLLAFFLKNTAVLYLSVAVSILGGIFFIGSGISIISGMALAAVGVIFAARRIKIDVNDSLSFNLSKSMRRGLPIFFTVIAFIISLTYFSSIAKDKQVFIPKSVFDISAGILQNYLGGLVPGFRKDATVNEILTNFAKNELKKQLNVNEIPKEKLNELVEEQKIALSKGMGIKISGREKTVDLLYNLTNQKIDELFGQYKEYLPYLSAIGFFLAIKVLTWPLYFISLILIYFTVKLMLFTGLLKKEVVTIKSEKLTF